MERRDVGITTYNGEYWFCYDDEEGGLIMSVAEAEEKISEVMGNIRLVRGSIPDKDNVEAV